MPIIFNVYAVLQAIIAIAILGLLHLLLQLFNFDYDLLGGTREAPFSLLVLAFVTAYTDAKGLSGRLFFLPTWVVLIIGSLFVFYITYFGAEKNNYQLFIWGISLLIIWFYLRKARKEIMIVWSKKKDALAALKNRLEATGKNDEEYWKIASQVYYKPSNLFIHANPLWKFFFKDAISGDDFLQYYRSFINTIQVDRLTNSKHREWIKELKDALNNAATFIEYMHPASAFTRLANVIDNMNSHFKNQSRTP
jgi:hypothetical protein